MASIFTKIISGEIPSYKVYEDEQFLAFLDINPLHEGHTLVIPKKEVDYIFNLDSDTYLALMTVAAKVAKAVEKAVPCKRIGVAVIGLEVAHTHIHLIPINTVGDINFSRPKMQFKPEEYQAIAKKIQALL